MPDVPSHDEPLPTRRKRAPLARAFRGLKRRLTLYRAIAVATVIALLAVGTYAFVETTDTESVTLGTGRAGVDVAATPPVSEPLPAAEAPAEPPTEAPVAEAPTQPLGSGDASYYGDELAGNPTASGERFDPAKLTAAHRTLPLGSRVRVTNLNNGESVVVRINDRGPFHGQRVIDLSKAAAREIGMLSRGTARVRLELLSRM
jgi:rare lipoprotein A (peptidoglycan hydrolase)